MADSSISIWTATPIFLVSRPHKIEPNWEVIMNVETKVTTAKFDGSDITTDKAMK
jgi:hypothetical protein